MSAPAVLLASLLLSAGCGTRTELYSSGGADSDSSSGTEAGIVACGDRLCDVGSGNQCYRCEKLGPYHCHTLDLPAECAAPVRIWCDGSEDCKPGEECVAWCPGGGACSLPERACR